LTHPVTAALRERPADSRIALVVGGGGMRGAVSGAGRGAGRARRAALHRRRVVGGDPVPSRAGRRGDDVLVLRSRRAGELVSAPGPGLEAGRVAVHDALGQLPKSVV
jgi:hypothetical protein